MKKLVVLFVCIMASLTLMAFDYTYEGVSFKCKLDGRYVCITGFPVKAKRVVIPAYVGYRGSKYQVKSVNVFMNGVNYLAEEVVLEEGIESIEKYCFNEFRKLIKVSLPVTIKHIGKNAFRDNKGMVFEMSSNIDEVALRDGSEFWSQSTALDVRKSVVAQTKQSQSQKPTPVPNKAEPVKQVKTKSSQPSVVDNSNNEEILADVDINIPSGSLVNQDTYCVIIANEKYEDVPEVEYAARDGEIFREYCIKTLGIPEKQVKSFINASYTDIKRAMNWMETIAGVTDGQAKFILYYAGHGIPSEKDRNAYIIPTDGFPKDLTTCYKLSELYARLGKIKAQCVTLFLDACFSGIQRGSNQALIAARGVAIKAKKEELSGNVVVFSATSDDETALSYQEKKHGMFTYYLLNTLKKYKGKINYGELYKSISTQVKKSSVLENEKLQSPSINCSASMKEKWQDLKL